MGKIIQFPLMPSLAASGNTEFEIPIKRYACPRKGAIVVSVMPDKAFPVGHRDLRPLLQRDGLILMSWAIWEDWNRDKSYERRYVVTWLASCGSRHLRHYATKPISQSEVAGAKPQRRGDAYFYRGECDRYYNSEAADYVYLTAPCDLKIKTAPAFVQELKKAGVTSDFDFPYSMEYLKKIEFAEKYLEKLASTDRPAFHRPG